MKSKSYSHKDVFPRVVELRENVITVETVRVGIIDKIDKSVLDTNAIYSRPFPIPAHKVSDSVHCRPFLQ